MYHIILILLLLVAIPANAPADQSAQIEDLFWESVSCKDSTQVLLYLHAYPKGRYVEKAKMCLAQADVYQLMQGLEKRIETVEQHRHSPCRECCCN